MSETTERQSTVSPETLAKIISWGRANLPAEYLENIKLVTMMYNKKHTATSVKDCVGGARAKLKLLFVMEFEPRTVNVCKKCKSKTCKKECGEQDFTDMVGYSYLGGDPSGNILVKIAPWEENVTTPEMEKVYEVEGFVSEYEGKLSIQAKKITAVSATTSAAPTESKTVAQATPSKIDQIARNTAEVKSVPPKAIEQAKNVISIFDNAIEEPKFFEVMQKAGFDKAIAEAAINSVGAERSLLEGNKVVISIPS